MSAGVRCGWRGDQVGIRGASGDDTREGSWGSGLGVLARDRSALAWRHDAAIGQGSPALFIRSGGALPVRQLTGSRAATLVLLLTVAAPTAGTARADSVPGLNGASLSWAASYRLATGSPPEPSSAGVERDAAAAGDSARPADHATGRSAPRRPDRAGLRRDTAYLLSYHVAAIGILYMLPESISNWSDEQKEEYSLSEWWGNVRNPQWDDDEHWINYLAHPYWGAAYYVRARERGFDERASFWYSVAMSTAYEFGAEALFEQPSLQDLVVTPVGGAILGEYFMAVRARTAARYAPGEELRFMDRALLAVTDPLGAINRRVQSWLGRPVDASVFPYFGPQRLAGRPSFAADQDGTDWVYGVRVHYRW